MESETYQEKGDEAETRFKEWLDLQNIPHWYIHQDLSTFSPSLKEYFGSKRPDFMILIPSIGFIFVDVKSRKMIQGYNKFPLDAEETMQYSNLQRNFNFPVWYVISNNEYGYKTWFWISASRVLEIGKRETYTSNITKSDFYGIPISDFIQIAFDDSLDRLFSRIFLKKK